MASKKKVEANDKEVVEEVKEVKEEVEKKSSDLTLSRLDKPTYEERDPVTTKGGPQNMFTIVTY